MGDSVTICECFARDGLQHESTFLPTDTKLKLLKLFADAGFSRIEATSYARPSVVPAFADASDLLRQLPRSAGIRYKATCPNVRAVERAVVDLEAGFGVDELSLLVSASESHSQRNLRASREHQWANIEEMARYAEGRFTLIGVVSTAFGCPFEGWVDPDVVMGDVEHFAALGVTLITLGDTVGQADPRSTESLVSRVLSLHPAVQLVAHFHNSRGTALANAVAAYHAGCRNFDTAMGGVGGHPAAIRYGAGDTGNACTEDLVGLFESMGVRTFIDKAKLMTASRACELALGRRLQSYVARETDGSTEGQPKGGPN
ncbi:MAG: hydroxymethylglutaryl-CoA lyase [Acidimicrobiales bacterium]